MIVCGWCHSETTPGRCSLCGRDPALPWVQRNQDPPKAREWAQTSFRRQVEDARRREPDLSDERIAELIGVSPRTFRRRMAADGRSLT